MFDLSPEKLIVLVLVALFVVGPERLPAAAAWLGQALRRVKTIIGAAQEQIRDELGPELAHLQHPLDELRVPLRQLHALREPARVLADHLLQPPATRIGRPEDATASGAQPGPFGPSGYDRDAT